MGTPFVSGEFFGEEDGVLGGAVEGEVVIEPFGVTDNGLALGGEGGNGNEEGFGVGAAVGNFIIIA